MTKEEGLSLGETAHPLKPHELRPPMASTAGNRATNKFKEFNADRMVSVQFNPSQQVKESKEPVTSKNIVVRVNQKISLFQLRMTPKINFKMTSGIAIPDFFMSLRGENGVISE